MTADWPVWLAEELAAARAAFRTMDCISHRSHIAPASKWNRTTMAREFELMRSVRKTKTERLTEESKLELQGEGVAGGIRVAHIRSFQISTGCGGAVNQFYTRYRLPRMNDNELGYLRFLDEVDSRPCHGTDPMRVLMRSSTAKEFSLPRMPYSNQLGIHTHTHMRTCTHACSVVLPAALWSMRSRRER